MNFRTELSLQRPTFNIGYDAKIVSMGSCFADMLAQKLNHHKFDILSNIYGTIFNPLVLSSHINNALSGDDINWHLVNSGNFQVSLLAHSSVFDEKQEALLEKLNQKNHLLRDTLLSSDFLIMTFGTAWVYEYQESQLTVANCHKLPSDLFKKKLLQIDEIVSQWEKTIYGLKKANPKLKIIFTVSPVRHIKDTLVLNNVSKSVLLLAVNQLVYRQEDVFYFPAFEFMMDDLRDYRFYKEDLLHPNEMAEKYIYDKFCNWVMNEETKNLQQKIESIQKMLAHKFIQTNTIAIEKHKEMIKNKINELPQLVKLRFEV